MASENYEEIIFEYLDGQSDKKDEAKLFKELARNEDLRNFFFEALKMKNRFAETTEIIPQEKSEAILSAIIDTTARIKRNEKSYNKFRRKNFVLYFVAAAIVLFGIFTYSMLDKYQTELNKMKEQIRMQNLTITAFINSYPEIKIEANEKIKKTIQKKL